MHVAILLSGWDDIRFFNWSQINFKAFSWNQQMKNTWAHLCPLHITSNVIKVFWKNQVWSNEEKRWPNLAQEKIVIWSNISETSGTNLPNLDIISLYLHGGIWKSRNMTHVNDIYFCKLKSNQSLRISNVENLATHCSPLHVTTKIPPCPKKHPQQIFHHF